MSRPDLKAVVLASMLGGAAALLPWDAAAQSRNCIDTLAGMPEYSRVVATVSRSHMVNELRYAQNITFFAPTNAAIEAVSAAMADRLFPRDEQGRRESDPVLAVAAVQAHLVQGRIPAAALADGLRLTTIAGTPLAIQTGSGPERQVTVSAGEQVSARVVQPDIPCANGVIHGIDRALLR